jgi:chemotaxis signal transduction protein
VIPAAHSSDSFVLLQVGSRRFALPASQVAELAPPLKIHMFPHTSDIVSGVIIRRSRIVPVYDASSVLIGRSSSLHRFYLIARREFGKTSELSAIPVDGDCELVSAEMHPRHPEQPVYVVGCIPVGEEFVDVVDFEALLSFRQAPAQRRTEVPS